MLRFYTCTITKSCSRRMLKKFVQQGRSERRADAYPLGYVEDLNDARTTPEDFFSVLPGNLCNPRRHSPETRSTAPLQPRGSGTASNYSTASLQPIERPFNLHMQTWSMAQSLSRRAKPPGEGVFPEHGFLHQASISTVPSSSERPDHLSASQNGSPGSHWSLHWLPLKRSNRSPPSASL